MSHPSVWVIGGFLGLMLAAGNAGAQACDGVDRILSTTGSLGALRGEALGPGRWRGQVTTVVGIGGCETWRLPNDTFSYVCRGEPKDSVDAVRSDVLHLRNALARCLPAGWSESSLSPGGFSFSSSGGATVSFLVDVMRVLDPGSRTWKHSASISALDLLPAKTVAAPREDSGAATQQEAAPPVPWRADLPAFCASLGRSLGDAETFFRTVRARPRDATTFIAAYDIAGLEACEVNVGRVEEETYLSCEVPGAIGAGRLRGAQDALLADVRNCLGSQWRSSAFTNSRGNRVIVLRSATALSTVEIREVGAVRRALELHVNSRD